MMDLMESFGVGLLVCLGIGLAYFVIKIIPYLLFGFDEKEKNKKFTM